MVRSNCLQQCAPEVMGEVASAYVALADVVGEEAMRKAADAMLSTLHDSHHAANLPPKAAVSLFGVAVCRGVVGCAGCDAVSCTAMMNDAHAALVVRHESKGLEL